MPKNCAICRVGTEGIPTFIVTQKRKDNWEFVIPIKLTVGDRICQTHFPEEFLEKETLKDKRSRVLLKPDAYPLVESEGINKNVQIISAANGNDHEIIKNQQSSEPNSVVNEWNSTNENSNDECDELALPFSPLSHHVKLDNSGMKQYGNKKSQMYRIPVHTNLIKEPCLDHSKLIHSTKHIFNLIYLNMNSVRFPPKWCRLIPKNTKSVIYSKINNQV